MPPDVVTRSERVEDAAEIRELVASAFEGKPYADGNEAELVDLLRSKGALVVSRLAVAGDEIVGQVAISPARTADGTGDWYALGPVAVLPSHQGRGIGSKLVVEALRAVRDLGAHGCILTGNPVFYRRFGFEVCPECAPPNEPAEYFMVHLMRGPLPEGAIHFHEAFDGAA